MALTEAKLQYHREWRAKNQAKVKDSFKRWHEKSGADRYYENLELTRAIKRKSYHVSVGNSFEAENEQVLIDKIRAEHPRKPLGAKRIYSAEEDHERRKATQRRHRYKHVEGIPKSLDGLISPAACEVCGGTRKISMDHCHETHKFRGWLCDDCNLAIGRTKDNPATLRALADYLEKHKGGH